LYNVASCWLYLKEYINDARSHERQIYTNCFHQRNNEKQLSKDPD